MDYINISMDYMVENFQKPMDSFVIYLLNYIWGRNPFFYYWFHEYWEEGVDVRTKDYLLVDISGISMLTALLTYVLLVVYIIPKWMKKRKAYNLKRIIIFYDFLLVGINAYFFSYTLYHIRDMFDFSNPKYDTSEKAMEFIKMAQLYYFSKFIDFWDTIFMGLTKKNSHITFLHVWHHFSMPGGGYLFLRYNPYMPTMYMLPLLNGFVHVIMYGYYGLAAFGPHMQKYLWWKKYITQIQLLQFTIGFIWFTYVIFKEEGLPFGYLFLNVTNDTVLLLLFLNFYIKSYKSDKKQKSN